METNQGGSGFKINFTTVLLAVVLLVPIVYFVYQRSSKSTEEPVMEETPISLTTLDAAREAVIRNPGAESYLTLGFQYYQKKMYKECIDATLKSIEYDPRNARAYNNICSAYNELGMYDKAIEACTQALAVDSSFTLAK